MGVETTTALAAGHRLDPERMQEPLVDAVFVLGDVELGQARPGVRLERIERGGEVGHVPEAALEVGHDARHRFDVHALHAGAEPGGLQQHDAAAHERVEHRQALTVGPAVVGLPEVPPGARHGCGEQRPGGRGEAPGEPLVGLVHRARPQSLPLRDPGDRGNREAAGVEEGARRQAACHLNLISQAVGNPGSETVNRTATLTPDWSGPLGADGWAIRY